MILGIISIVLCGNILTGIPAVILGHLAKSSIRKSGGRLGGDGQATAGLVMGYISFAFLPLLLAIFIPTLVRMRTHTASNEIAAQSTLRTLNLAQVSYSASYPDAGYARDLATLGPGPSGSCSGTGTQEHACLIDATLGCSRAWCIRNGYRFRVTASCGQDGKCGDYVVVAVPVSPGITGNKSYCSTSESAIRMRSGGSASDIPTIDECQTWSPV
jgi:hypothetical protein